MLIRAVKGLATILIGAWCFPWVGVCRAQIPAGGGAQQPELARPHVVVYVRDVSGAPVNSLALVTLTRMTNLSWQQMTAQGGQASFDVSPGRYTVQVSAGGYEKAVEDIDVIGIGGGESVYIAMKPEAAKGLVAGTAPGPPILAPKAQKELGKALEALRAGRLDEARKHLDAAYRLAPSHPDVNFLFGVYSSQTNDWPQAQAYWERAISFYPLHLLAQVSLSDALLRANKPAEAVPHLKKAVEIDLNSWRAHAFLADAQLKVGAPEEAEKEAEKAIAVGQERAAAVRPILARALAAQGKRENAMQVLESHLREHPGDVEAQKELSSLRSVQVKPGTHPIASGAASSASSSAAGSVNIGSSDAASVALPVARADIATPALMVPPLPSNWLPPDIDEKIPPVDASVPCTLNDVVEKAGSRVKELMKTVDHFSATESLFHESVTPWGLPAPPETRRFNYVASIHEVRPGVLSVYEYRDGSLGYEKFPSGVATTGLPSLVLIFHPYGAVNYHMRCEGLAHWNGRLAWQVHFRQRPDKPITDRVYRFGESGVAHPVALKGRAWIAADTFEIVRLETDLVAPLPEIRLVADHTIVEYGAVHFSKGNIDLWLPKTAEVFNELKGRRIHRRHSFGDFMLFSVDDRQKINAPRIPTTDDATKKSAPISSNP
jgi:tetratricopeptide (TPR) repeat protein